MNEIARGNNAVKEKKLPQGWRWVKLGEVCKLYQPETISMSQMLSSPGPYKVYGANGVIGNYEHYNHEDPEILVTCRGATCGTVNMSEPKCWITGNSMVVKPLDPQLLEKQFLYWILQGTNLRGAIAGAAQPQITRQSLNPVLIPLPPLPEQKRIAAILNEKMAQADTLRKEIETQLAEINAMPAAFLRKAFSGGL